MRDRISSPKDLEQDKDILLCLLLLNNMFEQYRKTRKISKNMYTRKKETRVPYAENPSESRPNRCQHAYS